MFSSALDSLEDKKKPGKPPKWSGLVEGTKITLTFPNLSFW
jgi:hypothetical protein